MLDHTLVMGLFQMLLHPEDSAVVSPVLAVQQKLAVLQ